jgi:hypothetical protein
VGFHVEFAFFQGKFIFGEDCLRFTLTAHTIFSGDNLYRDRFLVALGFFFFLVTVTVWGRVFCRI